MYKLAIFFSVCVVEIHNWKLYPPTQQFPKELGCYETENQRFLYFNESYSPENYKTCEKYTCDFDGYIRKTRCTETLEGDCLTVPGNKSLAYPDCCDILDCSKRSEIPANENIPTPKPDNIIIPVSPENVNSENTQLDQTQEAQNMPNTETTQNPSENLFNNSLNEDPVDSENLNNENTQLTQTQDPQNLANIETTQKPSEKRFNNSPLNEDADTRNENSTPPSLFPDNVLSSTSIKPENNLEVGSQNYNLEEQAFSNENPAISNEQTTNENTTPTEEEPADDTDTGNHEKQTTREDSEAKWTDITREKEDDENEDIQREASDNTQAKGIKERYANTDETN